jgi:hypothetical protein
MDSWLRQTQAVDDAAFYAALYRDRPSHPTSTSSYDGPVRAYAYTSLGLGLEPSPDDERTDVASRRGSSFAPLLPNGQEAPRLPAVNDQLALSPSFVSEYYPSPIELPPYIDPRTALATFELPAPTAEPGGRVKASSRTTFTPQQKCGPCPLTFATAEAIMGPRHRLALERLFNLARYPDDEAVAALANEHQLVRSLSLASPMPAQVLARTAHQGRQECASLALRYDESPYRACLQPGSSTAARDSEPVRRFSDAPWH